MTKQKAQVLTLDKVMQIDRLLWVEWKGCNCGSLQATATKSAGNFSIAFDNGEVHPIGLYGKQWWCWNAKPTEEQRKAVKWE